MENVPYLSAVSSLMYAMVCTRPDITHAVRVVSRYMSNPGWEHWQAVKWILRYLKDTRGLQLCFGGDSKLTIEGYVDADHAGCSDTRKSTTGYVFTIGGGAVSWMSRLQDIVALSSTESEYVALTEAVKEMFWLKGLLEQLGLEQMEYWYIVTIKVPYILQRMRHITQKLSTLINVTTSFVMCWSMGN